MKKFILLFVLIPAISVSIYMLINHLNTEKKIAQCINKILDTAEISGIQVETENRGQSPLIKGQVSKKNKERILALLQGKCEISELQDFLEIKAETKVTQAWLNFKIDNVNNIITVSGQVGKQSEIDNILNSFTTDDKNVIHSLSVNEQTPTIDFAVYITLILASIDNIQLADITINKDEIILKGLVRDKIRETEILSRLQQIFADELKINNQLEPVVKHISEIESLKFDLEPLPTPNETEN